MTLPGADDRVFLTPLGSPDAGREPLPLWWSAWVADSNARPAVWLLDGVDECLGPQEDRLDRVADAVEALPTDHLRALRLVILSRPYDELRAFRERLQARYESATRRTQLPQFWLTRLDRDAAAALVGQEAFPAVEELIRRNDLRSIAGYPVVLNFLKTYREAGGLTIPGVWRGVLTALLGEPSSNRSAHFTSTRDERFAAAGRIAAVLTLAHGHAVRDWSPDPGETTVATLFRSPNNIDHTAALETCRTALFIPTGAPPAYRFAQRNAQDWLTTFALERLPLAKLRSALSGPDGTLSPRLREVARLLRVVRSDPPAHDLIDRLAGGVLLPSDAAQSLPLAVVALDQLEAIAVGSPWGLRVGFDRRDELARLRTDGLGRVLADRLRDPGRTVQAKRLLIDVAEATNSTEAAEAAVELVLDSGQDDELRYDAAWMVNRLGGEEHLRRLERPIAEGGEDTAIGRRLRGVAVRSLLTRGLWPVWRAALNVPRTDPQLYDSRSEVLGLAEQDMTLADARRLLPHSTDLYRRHVNDHRPDHLPDFLARAVELVLAEAPPDPADVDQLLRFISDAKAIDFGWSLARNLAVRVRPVPYARQRLYRQDVETDEGRRLHVWNLLEPDDWPWLRDLLLGEWAGRREGWGHLYWLTSRAREAGRLPDEEWAALTDLVERHAPGVADEYEAGRRAYERHLAEEQEQARQRQEYERAAPSLTDRVTQVLDRSETVPGDRMRQLSWLCFRDDYGMPSEPETGWEDVPADLRTRVLDTCRRGLEAATPTPIPVTGSFPGVILAEGAAFAMVVRSAAEVGFLSEAAVRKWLPTALFARMSGDWTELLTACRAHAPAVTEAALLDTISFHARHDERPFVLRNVPAECWTASMTDRLAELVADPTVRPTARRELLEQLALRNPERAAPIATRWAEEELSTNETDQLRQGGRNVLLALNPGRALDLIEGDFAIRGAPALEELSALWDGAAGLDIRWSRWSTPDIGRFGRLLVSGFPSADDPAFRGGFVAPAQQLRFLRDQLVNTLITRTDQESVAAVACLAELDPRVRSWMDTHRANERAAQLLPTVNLAVRDPSALAVGDAVRLLDSAGFRLIRSAEDLLEAVVEALRAINADVGHDLAMLYAPPSRSGVRKHMREDALQAYLRRRLTDELSRLADRVHVQILREDQVARRQRFDLRVTAPCHGTGQLATVVVEIKWSTNNEVRDGLVTQLGDRYLIGERLTHGVFLVGWTGKWSPGRGSRRKADLDALALHLTDLCDGYCRQGQTGAGLRIEPFILDVQWSRMD